MRPSRGSLDEEGSNHTAENTDSDESTKLKEFPVCQVANFEHDNLVCAVRIEEFQSQCRRYTAKEGPKERLGWEEVRDLLEAEEDATYGCTESDSDS